MMSNPIIFSTVPVAGYVTSAERLGLGPTTMPETARAVMALDEAATAQALATRQQLSQQPNSGQMLQSIRTSTEWGMRMRVATASINPEGMEYRAPRWAEQDEESGNGNEDSPLDYRFTAVMSQRVQLAVRLGLPSEQAGRQLSIVV